jgi:hypothetical protein
LPRTDINPIVCVEGGNAIQASATTIDATLVTNGVRVVGAGRHKRIVILVRNDADAAKNVTLRKGVHAHAAWGDTVQSLAADTGEAVIYPSSMRHEQADESLHIDFESGTTGVLYVLAEPAVG